MGTGRPERPEGYVVTELQTGLPGGGGWPWLPLTVRISRPVCTSSAHLKPENENGDRRADLRFRVKEKVEKEDEYPHREKQEALHGFYSIDSLLRIL